MIKPFMQTFKTLDTDEENEGRRRRKKSKRDKK